MKITVLKKKNQKVWQKEISRRELKEENSKKRTQRRELKKGIQRRELKKENSKKGIQRKEFPIENLFIQMSELQETEGLDFLSFLISLSCSLQGLYTRQFYS